jgi:hypothetical protein
MKNAKRKIFLFLISTMAILAFAMAPALAKDSKNTKSSQASVQAAVTAGHVSEQGDALRADHHDSKPGPAWRTLGGTVKKIESNVYTVEDYEGNRIKFYVGDGTKHIKHKKVGDSVRAEITRGGFANSIQ